MPDKDSVASGDIYLVLHATHNHTQMGLSFRMCVCTVSRTAPVIDLSGETDDNTGKSDLNQDEPVSDNSVTIS